MLNLREANRKSRGIKSLRDNTLQGKSFLTAVFCCMRAILYPFSKIVVVSSTRGQALNILQKITMEIKPRSPELACEIDEKASKLNGTEAPSGQALSDALNQTKPGDEITVTVYRSGETLDLTLTIGEQTAEAQAATQKVSEELEKEQQAQQQQQQQEQQPQQGDGSQGGDPYWPFGSFGFGF